MEFYGCKHLVFDDRIDQAELVPLPQNLGCFWKRDADRIPEGAPVNVQFCEKRGRLNSKVACLKGQGECHLYDETKIKVEL